MRKLSNEFYAGLLDCYMKGSFAPHYEGGYSFKNTTNGYANLYWKEIKEHYSLEAVVLGNPEVTREIPELREFCSKLDEIANSPLMKALK